MLTKQDINELQETFATKDDLKNNQIDLKKEIQELKEELRANTNAIVGEIRTVIEMLGENIGKTKGHDTTLDDHEERIQKIEQTLPLN